MNVTVRGDIQQGCDATPPELIETTAKGIYYWCTFIIARVGTEGLLYMTPCGHLCACPYADGSCCICGGPTDVYTCNTCLARDE